MIKKLKIILIIIFIASIYAKGLSAVNATFTLYNQDGETFEPVKGTKFIITDLEGQNVVDVNGQIVGELENINGEDYYVVTTDENGYIKLELPQGLYKAIKIYANNSYILEENEEDRTYYFEIELEKFDIVQWIKGIGGYSWNYVNSTVVNTEGGVVVVGAISEYSSDVVGNYYDGTDLNLDGKIEEKSLGNNDGIIISYDENGNYLWSKTLGGIDNDVCKDIIQTKDGGYVIVGYISSKKVYLNGNFITELSNYAASGKDAFILKVNSIGEYEWGKRIGKNQDDEITKVIEDKYGDINVIGNFDGTPFISSYSQNGECNWRKNLEGDNFSEISDITEVENGFVVAVNYNCRASQVIKYSLEGQVQWYYDLYSSVNVATEDVFIKITSITTSKENQLIIGIAVSNTIKGKKDNEEDYSIIYSSNNKGIYADLIMLSSEGEFIKNIYELSGKTSNSAVINATMIFTDIVSTKDNSILVGGYYYSTESIDVDKDNYKLGQYDFKSSKEAHSNGFVIKLDLQGNVKFSNCIYRADDRLYASSNVTTVNEVNEKKIVFGGTFCWETATTKNFYEDYIDDINYNQYYLNRIGNIDGFVTYENIEGRYEKNLKDSNIIVNNTKKKVDIEYELPITGGRNILNLEILGIYLINYATYMNLNKEENE